MRTIAIVGCLVAASFAQRHNYVEDEEESEYQISPQVRQSNSRPSQLVSSNPKPTPVPILKQINRHNEDGSYTYGYEGADGSFKIETKLTTGEVMGKYGYIDDLGKVRVVEYGANKYGFMPSGEGITVAPPTLVDETTDKSGKKIVDYEDEPEPAPKYRLISKPAPRPQPVEYEQYEEEPRFQQPLQRPQSPVFVPASRPAPRPAPRAQHVVHSASPVPHRAVIPGAAPAFSPAPVYESPRSAPTRLPSPPPPQQPIFRAHQVPRGGRSGSVLDQLAQDYALPQGGRPTHDITFSSY